MKHLITLILLLSLKLLPGQVPTDGLSLQDVVTEIELPANSSLQDCFDNASAGGFDPAYDSPGDNRLSEFKGYMHGIPDASGNIYSVVEIGTRTWLAGNLKTRKYNDGTDIPYNISSATWDDATVGGACASPGGNVSNDDSYGLLYNGWAVMDTRGICPVGWHVSTESDWRDLQSALGMTDADIAKELAFSTSGNVGAKIAGSADLWTDDILEQNADFGAAGFNAVPGGQRNSTGAYEYPNTHTFLWLNDGYVHPKLITNYDIGLYTYHSRSENYGFSVRCVKGTLPTDASGNSYDTIRIGTRTWLAQSLRTRKYNDGTAIPYLDPNATWLATTEGACVLHLNNPVYEPNGLLYNSYAVKDKRGVCPEGWHISTDEDWRDLESALGMTAADLYKVNVYRTTGNVGSKLAAANNLWTNSNLETSTDFNKTGFNLIPNGFRNPTTAAYADITNSGHYWLKGAVYRRKIAYNSTGVHRNGGIDNVVLGIGIRCVKGTLPTDADGNSYATVKIGTQTWLAENLRTTKYRDGTDIPYVSGTTAWTTTTEGAYCYPNGSASNVHTYGLIYNGYAATDAKGICPEGWHVPTNAEWGVLEKELGMSDAEVATVNAWRETGSVGAKLSGGNNIWTAGTLTQSTAFNTTSGFSVLPGTNRHSNGTYGVPGGSICFWISTGDGKRLISSSRVGIYNQTNMSKNFGHYVRCVMD